MTTIGVFKFGEADYVQLAGVALILIGIALLTYNAIGGKSTTTSSTNAEKASTGNCKYFLHT